MRACVFACASLCAACQFDTRPVLLHPDGEFAPMAGMGAIAAGNVPMQSEAGSGAGSGGASAGRTAAAISGAGGVVAPPPMTGTAGAGSAGAPDPAVPNGPVPTMDAAPPHAGVDEHDKDAASDASPVLPDAGAEPPTGAKPGSPFTVCTETGDCDMGLTCSTTLPWLASMTPGYCTAFCGTSGTDTDAYACPQPSTGLVKAVCALGSPLCELDSCERSHCPDGMRCVHTQVPIGAGQVTDMYRCQR